MDKKIGVNQPKRIENAKILVANTPMDTDKIKVFGAKVRVDGTAKVADIEAAERVCPREGGGGGCDKLLSASFGCFARRLLADMRTQPLFLKHT